MIDGWSLRQKWYWDQLHNDVIQKIMRKARKGTKVIFIPGNHDENFRDFTGHRFGHVAIMREAVYKAPPASAISSSMATSLTTSSTSPLARKAWRLGL